MAVGAANLLGCPGAVCYRDCRVCDAACNPAGWQFAPLLAAVFMGMSGLGATIWPYVVPPGITIWDAAAPEKSKIFRLVGITLTLPLIIGYTVWAYGVFCGKVADEWYH